MTERARHHTNRHQLVKPGIIKDFTTFKTPRKKRKKERKRKKNALNPRALQSFRLRHTPKSRYSSSPSRLPEAVYRALPTRVAQTALPPHILSFLSSFHQRHLSPTAVMGKVHGSLARAGKVKAATPKVSFLFLFFHFLMVFLFDGIATWWMDGMNVNRHRMDRGGYNGGKCAEKKKKIGRGKRAMENFCYL